MSGVSRAATCGRPSSKAPPQTCAVVAGSGSADAPICTEAGTRAGVGPKPRGLELLMRSIRVRQGAEGSIRERRRAPFGQRSRQRRRRSTAAQLQRWRRQEALGSSHGQNWSRLSGCHIITCLGGASLWRMPSMLRKFKMLTSGSPSSVSTNVLSSDSVSITSSVPVGPAIFQGVAELDLRPCPRPAPPRPPVPPRPAF